MAEISTEPMVNDHMPSSPLYDMHLNPPYFIDFASTCSGKHVSVAKRRIRFRFGFSNASAFLNGATGIDCRGREHEVVLVWSHTSGKRMVLADDEEVHYSVGKPTQSKFQFSWTMHGNHILKLIAHATPALKAKSGRRQFDLQLDGQSVFDMPRIFELGVADSEVSFHSNELGRCLKYISHGPLFDMNMTVEPPKKFPNEEQNKRETDDTQHEMCDEVDLIGLGATDLICHHNALIDHQATSEAKTVDHVCSSWTVGGTSPHLLVNISKSSNSVPSLQGNEEKLLPANMPSTTTATNPVGYVSLINCSSGVPSATENNVECKAHFSSFTDLEQQMEHNSLHQDPALAGYLWNSSFSNVSHRSGRMSPDPSRAPYAETNAQVSPRTVTDLFRVEDVAGFGAALENLPILNDFDEQQPRETKCVAQGEAPSPENPFYNTGKATGQENQTGNRSSSAIPPNVGRLVTLSSRMSLSELKAARKEEGKYSAPTREIMKVWNTPEFVC